MAAYTVHIHARARGLWRLRLARLLIGRRLQRRTVEWAMRRLAIEVRSGGRVLKEIKPEWSIGDDGTIDYRLPA